MTAAMVSLLVTVLLYFAAKPLMLMILARFILQGETYEDFLRQLLRSVYTISITVLGAWLVFGNAATYFILYSTFCLLILLRFDFDDAEKDYQDTRNQMLRIKEDL